MDRISRFERNGMVKKEFKVPEVGQWPDRFVTAALVSAAVLTTAGFLMAFLAIPPVQGAAVNGAALIGDAMVTSKLLMSQKIFYFHMPAAIASFAALIFAGYYSIRFLMTRCERFDTCARIAMETSLIFIIFTMITGEMWTRFEWGVWWTWDPRLTTYLVILLLVIANIGLRAMVDAPEKRGVFSAVLAILTLVDVPICLVVTRLIPSSIHPVVVREGGMTPEMGMCVGVILVGMLLLVFALYRVRFRQVRLEQRIEAARETLGE